MIQKFKRQYKMTGSYFMLLIFGVQICLKHLSLLYKLFIASSKPHNMLRFFFSVCVEVIATPDFFQTIVANGLLGSYAVTL